MEEQKQQAPPNYDPALNQFPNTAPPQYIQGGYPPQQGYAIAGQPAPYGQQHVVQPAGPVVMANGGRPQSHLLMSVFACLFCFWPTGIVALMHSFEVDNRYSRGDYAGSMQSSLSAYKWAKITIVIGVIISCVCVALVVGINILRIILSATV